MTIDTAFAALVEANPIPDANANAEHRMRAAAFLTVTRERKNDMQTIETQEPTKETTRRKWQPLVAVAAFFLVVALGVTAALMFQGSKEVANVPAPPFDTPQEALEAYYAAVNIGDADAYLAIMVEDGLDGDINSAGIATEDKIRARVAWYYVIGASGTIADCTAETELRAKCTVVFEDAVGGTITGVPEFTATVVLSIDEQGRIERIGMPQNINMSRDEVRVAASAEWIVENYPELDEEIKFQIWGSAPLERSGAEIAQDFLAAVEAFDAQYEG